jgi:hypothetical protein
MTAQIVQTIASELCSIRSPYHAFVHSEGKIVIYNSSAEDELATCSLAGHDLTSMVTTDQGIFIGTTKGTYAHIAYEHSGDKHLKTEFHSIKGVKNKPLFVFGGDGALLCIGTEWEGPLDRMRCGRLAMVGQGEPCFLPLQGVIVAHQFDSRYNRQLLVMELEESAQCQLWIVSFGADHLDLQKKMYTIDRRSTLGDRHEYWTVQAVSREGHVAFINGEILYIVDPMSNSAAMEPLFIENALKELKWGPVCFTSQKDMFAVYCAISGSTALQICTVSYNEGEWKKHTSFVLDLQDKLEGATILESSIARDSGDDDNGLVIKLLLESKEDICMLSALFASLRVEAFGDGDPASFELTYTRVSLPL